MHAKSLISITLLLLVFCLSQPALANDIESDQTGLNLSSNTGTPPEASREMPSGTPPGAEKFSADLHKHIRELKQSRGDTYKPRTRHLLPNGQAKYTNRLFLETSPYLLQHAHNPVNWYPWGDAAFIAAAKLNRPVFLSVGYSTCHWCHVMEEESFEDLEIATFINENYIAIKVDREERPDIDAIYMAALHALGQSGGWPMNVWLTPDRKPFYGGTYFAPRDGVRGASTGLLTLLSKLKLIYQLQPDDVLATSQNLAEAIKANLIPVPGSSLPAEKVLHVAAKYYKDNFDTFYGGIGYAPKFPSSTPIQFLLRYYQRTGDADILKIVTVSLSMMANGGIYDQVGGGFHRYSIDTEWLVPHFEKMLYDNALLAVDYLEAYQVTKDEKFRHISTEILTYIMREMTSKYGGFYSATDADSVTPSGERAEGYYFTWSEQELIDSLGPQRYRIFKAYYATSKDGNFDDRNILNTPNSIEELTKSLNINKADIAKVIAESKQRLYQLRKKRRAPLRDEKILTAWNGLTISAFAKAGLALNNREFTQQAVSSAHFILNNLYKNGRLYRSYKDAKAKNNAYLDDYAFLIAALLDVYEATFDIQWINKAIEIDQILTTQFEDQKHGGYFMTSNDHEELLSREKPNYDSALPTGNSIQVLNLLRLAEFTSQKSYLKRAEKSLKSFSPILNETPMALSRMLLALDFYYGAAKEIVIITPEGKKNTSQVFLDELQKHYLPNRVLSVMSEGLDYEKQSKIISIAEAKIAIRGKTTAYVCRQGACELPTQDISIFAKQINTPYTNSQ